MDGPAAAATGRAASAPVRPGGLGPGLVPWPPCGRSRRRD